jgi:hypothetical protein
LPAATAAAAAAQIGHDLFHVVLVEQGLSFVRVVFEQL